MGVPGLHFFGDSAAGWWSDLHPLVKNIWDGTFTLRGDSRTVVADS